MKKFRELSEQHREKGRFKPTIPRNVSSTPGGTPRDTSDSANVRLREAIKNKFDIGEYDQEGDMAKSDLRSIIANAKRMHDMIKDSDNLPEWVQSKITKSEDYMSTVANYLEAEMNEEVELDEAHTMVCKDCGDKFGKPTNKTCPHDSHNPKGSNWVEKIDEALRHEIAGQVARFIGNKIDPVHGDIMHAHGKEAYRQAAYHIRGTIHHVSKAISDLHDKLHHHLRTGNPIKIGEEVEELDEGKYGSFRVRMTSGTFGGPKLPRRGYGYVPQGDTDPRTGLPLGFSHPPKKDEPKKVKEEVEQIDEISTTAAKNYLHKALPSSSKLNQKAAKPGEEASKASDYSHENAPYETKEFKKFSQRRTGIRKAINKLASAHPDNKKHAKIARQAFDSIHNANYRVGMGEPNDNDRANIRDAHKTVKTAVNIMHKNAMKKEEVEQIDEISAEKASAVARARDLAFRKNKPTATQQRKMAKGYWRGIPDINANAAYLSAIKRGADDPYQYGKKKKTNEEVELSEAMSHSELADHHNRLADHYSKVSDRLENQGNSYDADHFGEVTGAHRTAARAHEKAAKTGNPEHSKEAHEESKTANSYDVSESVKHLEEKNVPTSPEKWAQAKAQAKAKFDVYPSAYANGWAAKKYKSMGGGWKSVSEDVDLEEGYFKNQEIERQETERLAKRNEPPFTPDKPKKKSVVVGKKPEGYSRARQLARQAMQKYKTPVKEAKETSKKAKIIKDAMKKTSDDKFESQPALNSTITNDL